MHAFDRDGCIIGTPWNFAANHPSHIRRPQDQVINPLVAAVIKSLPDESIIISNQQGCRWGYKDVPTVIAEMQWLMKRLPIARAYFCPDGGESCVWASCQDWGVCNQITHPEVNFRKPGNGMFIVAKEQGYEPSVYIGDVSGYKYGGYEGKDSDLQAALNYGIRFIDVRDFFQN